jgi:HSP20 family protein
MTKVREDYIGDWYDLTRVFPALMSGVTMPRIDKSTQVGLDVNGNKSGKCMYSRGRNEIPMSVMEYKNYFLVKMDLPGINKEDISIVFDDSGALDVSAERFEKFNKDDGAGNETNNGQLVFSDRKLGEVRRHIAFDIAIDKNSIAASCKDGVLEISLPKKQDVVKKITVS